MNGSQLEPGIGTKFCEMGPLETETVFLLPVSSSKQDKSVAQIVHIYYGL